MLFIKYENMKSNLSEVVDKTAGFLGKQMSDEEKSKLLKHLSFESMKTNMAVNYEPIIDFHRKHNLVHVDGAFMRSGSKVNRKMELSQEMDQVMSAWIDENDPNNELGYCYRQ